MSASSRPVPYVFCGTSDFAADVLRRLAGSSHRPVLVVTPPDRKSGRGRKVSLPPAAMAAGELDIELLQTPSVNQENSREEILGARAELAIVCAFGQLIGSELLAALPVINAHPSLLPRWRGAAPVERAMMAGDATTGTCVMRVSEGLDSGPVALRVETPIEATDTYGSLGPRLAELSASLLLEALDLQATGELEDRFVGQDDEGATYAEKIVAADRVVDPTRTASEEDLRIRALTPHIGAALALEGGDRLGVRSGGAVSEGPAEATFAAAGEELLLGCSDGAVRISEMQPAGGRWMSAADYLRGRGVPPPPAQAN